VWKSGQTIISNVHKLLYIAIFYIIKFSFVFNKSARDDNEVDAAEGLAPSYTVNTRDVKSSSS